MVLIIVAKLGVRTVII